MNKKTKSLIAVATAGVIAGFMAPKAWAGDNAHGSQPAAEATKAGCHGKDSCKGKEKDSCKGKESGAKDGCSGKDGCDGTHKEGATH